MRLGLCVLLCSVFLCVPAAACNNQFPSTASEEATIAPEAGKGGITGIVTEVPKRWNGAPILIFAAPFTGNDKGEGFSMLAPSIHLKTELDSNGYFRLTHIVPGSYALLVGPDAETAKQIIGDDNKMRVIAIKADQILDLGELTLAP